MRVYTGEHRTSSCHCCLLRQRECNWPKLPKESHESVGNAAALQKAPATVTANASSKLRRWLRPWIRKISLSSPRARRCYLAYRERLPVVGSQAKEASLGAQFSRWGVCTVLVGLKPPDDGRFAERRLLFPSLLPCGCLPRRSHRHGCALIAASQRQFLSPVGTCSSSTSAAQGASTDRQSGGERKQAMAHACITEGETPLARARAGVLLRRPESRRSPDAPRQRRLHECTPRPAKCRADEARRRVVRDFVPCSSSVPVGRRRCWFDGFFSWTPFSVCAAFRFSAAFGFRLFSAALRCSFGVSCAPRVLASGETRGK